ncbi:MAG TPA: hypothetical protein VMM85_01505 [Methylomirabilota bacterium]|nr:hypothetical protein [Methylomirabilota bacterium]
MPDTLTESFCERCGTRYEFKAPTRLNPLRKTRGFVSGLRNYLTSQDALSDAMTDAIRAEEDQIASAQLDAFHESFNFCIGCRQYTCVNCWNESAGRCRSCAPIAGTDDLAERVAASLASTAPPAPTLAMAPDAVASAPDVASTPAMWPVSDMPAPASSGTWVEEPSSGTEPAYEPVYQPEPEPAYEPVYQPEPEPAYEPVYQPEPKIEPEPIYQAEVAPEPEPIFQPEPEPEPIYQAEVAPEPEPIFQAEVAPEPEPEPVAAEVEPEPVAPMLRVVGWDEDAAYDVVEVEPEPVAAEVEPEPVAAEVEPEPEPIFQAEVEPEPEPIFQAEVEPEPEPIAATTITPISETILRPPPVVEPARAIPPAERVAAEADSPELAARRAQLDLLGLGDPGEGPVAPGRPSVIPYRSRGAAANPAALSARAASLRGASFWEASAREVAGAAAQVGVQDCGQCGLSLSANARFCRRCGTPQQRSA